MDFHRVLIFSLLAIVYVSGQTQPECNPATCAEPNCRCWNAQSPGGLDPTEIPQMVFLTFDESITISNYQNYTYILNNRKNPNGCPIGMTFFVTHDYTNYGQINALYKRGAEIALHSIRGAATNSDYWKTADEATWLSEMDGLKTIIARHANIPRTSITGGRAPFVQPGGDPMIRALKNASNSYDASYHTRNYISPPIWPYTRDFKSGQDCQNPPCPVDSHPGFWAVPMVDLVLNDTQYCSMVDQCGSPVDEDEQFEFLLRNFNRHYESNRAPFGIYAHSAWFQGRPHLLTGYTRFLDHILSFGDVFIITMQKGLSWMKTPTSLTNINNFDPWKCPSIVAPCRSIECTYLDVEAGGDRILTTCASACPNNYPWFGNPNGQ